MSRLFKLYLLSYNSLLALGWTLSLFKILSNFSLTKSVSGTYASAGELICFLQTIAFLEVIHGAIGIVPSGVLFPLMQWGGRTHFLLAVVRGINEVIRYLHYAINSTGNPPYWITYLSVAHVPSTSFHKGKKFICRFLCFPPFQLLHICCDSAHLLSISVAETVPSLVQAEIVKTP
ncbi:very-long-chain (3R)-3-hydroxyacyl-CoA dehydratase PASTICCINO 2B-like isoform X4 [Coffea arabica]|uniref:Very-long-chain (3R)-3-hydroxyacyl-CoA dehydratase n=1 Tax=Coffea arabica TaxID=13443 RepID=A0ABM4V959_COFAR